MCNRKCASADENIFRQNDLRLCPGRNPRNNPSCLGHSNEQNEDNSSEQIRDKVRGQQHPAPQVIAFEEDDSYSYLLMTRVRGKIACDKYYLERPKELVPLLSKSVKMLQSIDITDCPVIKDLDRELKKAAYRVENGLVDISDAEPDTFGENGRFKDPEDLLSWLKENRPSYELVLSHGDLCLPNILIENGIISGFIDMGNCGIADKWEDIAMLYRSLRHNFDGTYGKVYPGLDPDSFFEELGIAPDRKKIDYYILLDELF